jgi:hypothetical protein
MRNLSRLLVLLLLFGAIYFTSPGISAAAQSCPDQFQSDSCSSLCRPYGRGCFPGSSDCNADGCLDCYCFCGGGPDFYADTFCG